MHKKEWAHENEIPGHWEMREVSDREHKLIHKVLGPITQYKPDENIPKGHVEGNEDGLHLNSADHADEWKKRIKAKGLDYRVVDGDHGFDNGKAIVRLIGPKNKLKSHYLAKNGPEDAKEMHPHLFESIEEDNIGDNMDNINESALGGTRVDVGPISGTATELRGHADKLRKKYGIEAHLHIPKEYKGYPNKSIHASYVGHRDKLKHILRDFHDMSDSTIAKDFPHLNESAADTLKPNGGSGGGDTKAEVLATFTALLSQLGKEDLSKLYDNQFSALMSKISDNSEENKNTVDMKNSNNVRKSADPMPKLSVKEDVAEMFGEEDLNEDFKERAEVIFEAALNTRVLLEKAALEEEFEANITEAYKTLEEEFETKLIESVEEIQEQLDKYLDYVVSSWIEENKVEIESNLKTEIAEDFMIGLKNLFSEHYIDIPEQKLDLVNELKNKNDILSSELEEATRELIDLKSIVEDSVKDSLVDEIAEGLSFIDKERLKTLSEGVDFSDENTFRKKLEIIKESYFSTKKKKSESKFISEEIAFEGDTQSKVVSRDPEMDAYVKAVSRSVK